jgi:hypothetical protein
VFLAADGSIAHVEAGAMVTEADVGDAVQHYLGIGG